MVNGADLVTTGEWRSQYHWVVRIRMGNQQLPSCTGTLWNRYVLTAAHCLPNKLTPDDTEMTGCVSRGPGHYEEGSPPRFDAIARIIRVVRNFWGGNPNWPEQDIAILELDRAPETGGLPIRFTRTIPPTGSEVFIVAYGPNEEDDEPLSNTYEPRRASYNLISQHYYFLDQWWLGSELRWWRGGAWTRSKSNAKTISGDSGAPRFALHESITGLTAVIFAVHNGRLVDPLEFPEDVRENGDLLVTDEFSSPFAVKHPDDDESEDPVFPYPQDPTVSEDVVAAMRLLRFPFDDGDIVESSQNQVYTKLRSTSSISLPTNVSSATGNAKDSAMISGCYGRAAMSWNFAVISILMYF